MQAEDLDFAPVITWWNNSNLWKDQRSPSELTRTFDGHRLYSVMAGEDEREGGALFYFGLDRPLDIAGSKREFPSPMKFVDAGARATTERLDRHRKAVLVGRAGLAGQRPDELHRPGQQSHVPQPHARRRSLGQAARRGSTAQPARQRLLDAGDLLPRSQQRAADSAVRRQRLGRAAQSGRLQPRLCASR